MRGAIQLGYRKEHFDPAYHMREHQIEDDPQMHSSCTALLSKLVCKIAGYRQYTGLQTTDFNSPSNMLYIGPFGICLLIGVEKCTRQLVTAMADLDIFRCRRSSLQDSQTVDSMVRRTTPERCNIFHMAPFLQVNRVSLTDQSQGKKHKLLVKYARRLRLKPRPDIRQNPRVLLHSKIDGNATDDMINGMKIPQGPDTTTVNAGGTTISGTGDLIRAFCRSHRLHQHMLDMANCTTFRADFFDAFILSFPPIAFDVAMSHGSRHF